MAHHGFPSSAFPPVGGLSWNSNISSSRGNGEQPQRRPKLRSLWIINIHSRPRGGRGLPHANTAESSNRQQASVNSPSQAVLAHTHTHELGPCLNDLLHLNADCDKCRHTPHTHTRTILLLFQPEVWLRGLPSVHTAPFPPSCYRSADTVEDDANCRSRKWSLRFYVLQCKGFLSFSCTWNFSVEDWFRTNHLQSLVLWTMEMSLEHYFLISYLLTFILIWSTFIPTLKVFFLKTTAVVKLH